MKLFLILSLLVPSFAFAQGGARAVVAPQMSLDLLPLELQMRYEDANDQTRTNHQYQAYGIGFQYTDFRAELEYSQFYDATGNASLKIEQSIKEFNLGLGYQVYHLADANQKLSLSGLINLWLGQTQTIIDTTLLGAKSTSESEKENVLGAGFVVIGRISYFMIETDFKVLNSKNMNPREVPVFALKLGLGIPL